MRDGSKKARRTSTDQASLPDVLGAKRLALRIQYGALGYRRTETGEIEILLITSRNTKRWIIPKGWPIKGLKPCDSAAQEAFEEAGVRGRVARRPVGHYVYAKRLKAGSRAVPCELEIYALDVHTQEKQWPEAGQREIRWFSPEEAIAVADERELSDLISAFVAHRAKGAEGVIGLETKASARKKLAGKR